MKKSILILATISIIMGLVGCQAKESTSSQVSSSANNSSESITTSLQSETQSKSNTSATKSFSESIDTSKFNATLFDGKINIAKNVTISTPITYDKIMQLGYTCIETSIDGVLENKIFVSGDGGRLRYGSPTSESDFVVGVANTTKSDATAVDCFKNNVFSFHDHNEYMGGEYAWLPMLYTGETDATGLRDKMSYEEFKTLVLNKIGVPSIVAKEEYNQYANFLYVYNYGEYYIVLQIYENVENKTIELNGYSYYTKLSVENRNPFK